MGSELRRPLGISIVGGLIFSQMLTLYLATVLKSRWAPAGNLMVFNLVDGTIRIVLFLAFLTALAQMKDIKRIFEYHGAEHKVVW